MTKKTSDETPLMKQYNTIKAKYPDALLLFRVGDFYETFNEDAIKASKILGTSIAVRSFQCEAEMSVNDKILEESVS